MFAQIRSIIIMHGIFVYHEDNSFAGVDPWSEFGEIQPLCSNSESNANFAPCHCLELFQFSALNRPNCGPIDSLSRISKILVVFVEATDLAAAAAEAIYVEAATAELQNRFHSEGR